MVHDSVIHQYSYEVESWNRLLAFCLVENIYFKTRLSEIINDTEDEELVIQGELFQEQFIEQDRILSFLEDEVNRQRKMLERDAYEDGELFKEIVKHQKKLRNDIKSSEALFARTRNTFSDFLKERFGV